MGLTRALQSPSTVQRNFKVTRLSRRDGVHVRTLWWWARRSRNWFSQDLDDMEERLRRHQALMMHRYSKALRRRALWDRENSPCHPVWKLRGHRLEREMSSTNPRRAKVEEGESRDSVTKEPWKEFHEDFESFKKAVDRAIERDPYGTLFGRRLRSPDTANNSSWTSWSWIFDPKEIKEEPVTDPPKPEEKASEPKMSEPKMSEAKMLAPEATNVTAPKAALVQAEDGTGAPQPMVTHTSSSSRTETTLKSTQSIMFTNNTSSTTMYVYDPISGRKVPQPTPAVADPPLKQVPPGERSPAPTPKPTKSATKAPEKDFLQNMFGENGVEIPVKTYKPHKVYGYTGETKPSATASGPQSRAQKFLETSTKRDYDLMRLRTMGNNIDATNFNCEPWNNKQPEAPNNTHAETSAEKRAPIPLVTDDSALFAGTTYASRAAQFVQPEKANFLDKEGFRERQGMTIPSLKETDPPQARTEPVAKMQPALDRTNATEIPVKKFASKLQPAVDRVMPTVKEQKPAQKPPFPVSQSDLSSTQERKEDIDLLRASDVRAAARAARITKQEMEEQTKEQRKRLDNDFEALSKEKDEQLFSLTSSTGKLDHVWQHIKRYPQGIVAKTLKSLGISPSNDTAKATGEHGVSPTNPTDPAPIPKPVPAFSEPTVKPGIVRNLVVERHTQVFEPQIADIVDTAKTVKRNLHDIQRDIGDVINTRALAAMADRHLIMSEEKPTSVTQIRSAEKQKLDKTEESSRPAPAAPTPNFQSPYLLLVYNKSIDDVELTALDNLTGQHSVPEANMNAMAAIGSLHHPNSFVKHFVELDRHGYELMSGGNDVLIFKKRESKAAPTDSLVSPNLPSTSELRRTIAAAESAAQSEPTTKRAAKVLDEIPTSIPVPGPAAPTAPPSPAPSKMPFETPSVSTTPDTPLSSLSSAPKNEAAASGPPLQDVPNATQIDTSPLVNRQEQVFSGQVRLPPHTTGLPDPEHFQKQTPISKPSSTSHRESWEPRLGFFARLRRGIRRVVLTALAFGLGAYGIGVVAEAINAKAQIAGAESGGPMKRLVLEESRDQGERQRAGIFSTESSR